MILVKHGFDQPNGIQAISMESPSEETAPTAAGLNTLQPFAGELNWLATRSRADLAYVTSLLASCLAKYPKRATRLWETVMRYLRGTAGAGLFLATVGSNPSWKHGRTLVLVASGLDLNQACSCHGLVPVFFGAAHDRP